MSLLKRTDMGELSPWHLLILAAVFVVLFGSRKLPDAARALGKSMRIFKAETRALRGDDETAGDARQIPTVQQAPVQQPAAHVATPAGTTVTTPAAAPPGTDGTAVSGTPAAEAQRNQQTT
jgi:sec-independent protein translocase protein TatA